MRCVCGHPADVHRHYRPGADCGACGRGGCPDYVALADRYTRYGDLTASQRVRLAESDAQAHQVIANLIGFTAGYRERALMLAATIPMQRRVPTIAHELDARRAARTAQRQGRDKGVSQ